MIFQLDRGLFQFDFTDRHAILGVSVNAQEMNIRERYQAVARSLHPDSGKWKTAEEQQLAVRLFSRLVTHAYGQLSKSSQLKEQTIMLELLGKRLVEQGNRVQITDPLGQQLFQSGSDFELVYTQILSQIVAEQYVDLGKSEQIINQISELNMVYLLRKQLQGVSSKPPVGTPNAAPSASSSNTSTGSKELSGDLARASSIEGALRRAEDRMSRKNWVQAVQELREVISLEPNNPRAHALLGLVYLRQQQMTMAKISINKAIQLAPKDAQVIQAKQEFDRTANSNTASAKAAANKPREGLFGLFGKK
jgi:tetratricopeptide (TPR) repeat protein